MLAQAAGWRAQLSMRLGPRGDRTRVRALSHQGPLRVQRLFHPEPDGTAHVYVLHPPGGVVAGDELCIDARIERDGAALVTTPGATKLYRGDLAISRIATALEVARGATLEHVPQETIAFDGARARLSTRVVLEPGGRFLGWELLGLGRPACGERFDRGSLGVSLEIVAPDGAPRLVERGCVDPALARARFGLRGHAAMGTLVATEGDLDAVRAILARHAGVEGSAAMAGPAAPRPLLASATRIAELVVVRALAGDLARVRSALEDVRHHVRACWGRAPIDPAIWRT